jgi:predicted PurR-regulated permease PerM
LNPLAILVSVMFWTWLWGAIGILLAIPITASAKVICDHVEALQPIGILLGGKVEK